MKTIRILTMGSLVALLASCVPPPSLQPLYHEDDVIVEPGLVGVWSTANGDALAIFHETGAGGYRVAYWSDGDGKFSDATWSQFKGHLVRLGGYLFLDLYPESAGRNLSESDKVVLVPVHAFYRLEISGDRLQISFLNIEWLRERSEEGQLSVDHSLLEDSLILTASTDDLQSFLSLHAGDPEAFKEFGEFHRQGR